MSDPIKNRYDFVLFFDVADGNPNGDPDAGNLPRVDPETGNGLVTDVCLKRKIRNRIQLAKAGVPGYNIFIREKAVLNDVMEQTCADLKDAEEEVTDAKGKTKKKTVSKVADRTARMCAAFYDIRTFGAVLSTGIKCGQVRGPVQLTFARSVDPIVTLEHSITRMAVATAEEAEKQSGDNRTMGRKNTVPYGLYRAHGFVIPSFAVRTGFGEADLDALWEAIRMMFNEDPSSSHGTMATRRLIVFEHKSALGNAPAAELFDRVTVTRNNPEVPARGFSDYTINVDTASLPPGVSCWQK